MALLGLDGVIEMDARVAEVTVRVLDADLPPDAAMIVVEPAATDVANPEALIDAAPVLDELQVDVAVKFCVDPSEYVAVATN